MAKKLKIAILNITQGGVQRGAEAFVDGLSERLSESHKVEIFTDGRRKMPKRWPVVWRCYLDPYGLAVLWFTLRNLARIWRGKYDVVIPVNGGWEAVLVRLMTWTYGSKIVISGHSGRGWDDRINLWCMPDVFVALTRDGLRWAKRACPFVRVERIVNGVDLEKFKPDGDKYEHGLEHPVVLCVGALVAEKQINKVVEAVAGMGSASILVVGKGPLESEIGFLGKRLLGKRFGLVGVKYEDMPSVYRACDVFVFLQRSSEAFGIVYLEAMASGLPVVAADDSVRREILGDAGVFVDDSGNVDGLGEVIEKALETDWGMRPREQAKNFSWDKIAVQYEKVFNSLLGR